MATIPEALNLALRHHQAGQWAQAEQLYQEVLRSSPDHPDALHLLGLLSHQQGKLETAIDYLRRAIAANPNNAIFHANLGNLLYMQGALEQAEAAYRRAIQLKPDHAEAYSNLGNVLKNRGNLDQAEAAYRQAIQLKPDFAEAYSNLGVTLTDRGRLDEALAAYEQAVALRPDYAEAHNNLGHALRRQKKFDRALVSYQQAVAIRPDYAEALNNLGNALNDLGRPEEAETAYQRTLAIKPDYAEAHNNLGNALKAQGKFQEAVAAYERAAQIRPDYAQAHFNRSLMLLRQGDLERGLPEYEWRSKTKEFAGGHFDQPLFDGSDVQGKTILLHADYGLGDTLHFIRYAPLVHDRGAKVILQCQKPLLPILARTPGVDRLVAKGDELPTFDFHAPLSSLPWIFRTSLESIPAPIPYIQARDDLVQHWRGRLGELDGFKIGICWQGSPTYTSDRQRSIPLAEFGTLAELAGVRLFSLQKGAGSEQIDGLGGSFEVCNFGSDLDEASGPFMDTAAIITNLDLVIAPDTALAHLAGALGARVWLALAFVADWRWFTDRDDSPWYPQTRLFRQPRPGQWQSVFRQMRTVLETLISDSQPASSREQGPPPAATMQAEIAPGELIDKITILQIKQVQITDPQKLHNVRVELDSLLSVRDGALTPSDELTELTRQLKEVNQALWQIEDQIRLCERDNDFGPNFVELARSVYRNNDRRAALKGQINALLGSRLIEEKSYTKYQ